MLSLPILFVGVFVSYAQAQYTLDDVAMHATNSDCWSAAFGEVYDLTAYAPNHPNPSIYSMCGKDGTAVFESAHGNVRQEVSPVGHQTSCYISSQIFFFPLYLDRT